MTETNGAQEAQPQVKNFSIGEIAEHVVKEALKLLSKRIQDHVTIVPDMPQEVVPDYNFNYLYQVCQNIALQNYSLRAELEELKSTLINHRDNPKAHPEIWEKIKQNG